jgi:hypothetical protein
MLNSSLVRSFAQSSLTSFRLSLLELLDRRWRRLSADPGWHRLLGVVLKDP